MVTVAKINDNNNNNNIIKPEYYVYVSYNIIHFVYIPNESYYNIAWQVQVYTHPLIHECATLGDDNGYICLRVYQGFIQWHGGGGQFPLQTPLQRI